MAAALGREAMKLIIASKEEVDRGNILGATILFSLGIYFIIQANRLKKGHFCLGKIVTSD
jgi:hypothetical protein